MQSKVLKILRKNVNFDDTLKFYHSNIFESLADSFLFLFESNSSIILISNNVCYEVLKSLITSKIFKVLIVRKRNLQSSLERAFPKKGLSNAAM